MLSDKERIRQEALSIIAEQLSKPVTALHDDDTLEKLGADSLDRIEIIMKLEEHFGIEISDEQAEKIHNIGQVIDYVAQLKQSI